MLGDLINVDLSEEVMQDPDKENHADSLQEVIKKEKEKLKEKKA